MFPIGPILRAKISTIGWISEIAREHYVAKMGGFSANGAHESSPAAFFLVRPLPVAFRASDLPE